MLTSLKCPFYQTVFNFNVPVMKECNHCPPCNRIAEGFVPCVALGGFGTFHLNPHIITFCTIWVGVKVMHRKLVGTWVINENFVFNDTNARLFVVVLAVPLMNEHG